MMDITEQLTDKAGIITEIERYSIHDGPGVRTVVFLKGCQLNCLWCCNPETLKPFIELAWFEHLCMHCKNCIEDCPYGSIKEGDDGQLITNRSICRKYCFGKVDIFPCTTRCYSEARKAIGTLMSVNQVVVEVEKDRNLFKRTGGGVTLSGGEVSMQPDFAIALSKVLSERWINVAIETNGFGDIDFYRNIARYLSFAFFDIKTLDPYLHKKFTGGSVDTVIEFSKEFSKIAERNEIDVIARIPIIPGFNNDIQHISQIARFVKEELNGINKIEILPFHKLGQNKYESIGRVYKYQEFNSFKTSMFEEYKEEINKFGIDVISF